MSVVIQPFHAAVNHLLAREPWARQQLVPYAGKRARLGAPPFSVTVRISAAGYVEPFAEDASDILDDVSITVLPDALPAMLRGGMPAAMKHVRIGGDAEFAATLGKLAEHLRWEPEEDLARFVGDAAAHRLVSTARALLERVQRASQGWLESIAEYGLDERPVWVRHRRVETFGKEVAVLRDDVERLEKRLARLERRGSTPGERA